MAEGAADSKDGLSKEVYRYKAPWPIYSLNWSRKDNKPFRAAIGSFVEQYSNKIRIIQLNEETQELEMYSQVDHPYPATKIMWLPDEKDTRPDLFATTGDYLRIWKNDPESSSTTMECLLNNNKSSEFCAPLTSFDWNVVDPSRIATCSIDTTVTVWDIQAQRSIGRASGEVKTQLIAHDQEVYDVAFGQNTNVFASVGADGSVRLFDLRNLDHSTIVFEEANQTPLLRLSWNLSDPNYVAFLKMDSKEVIILDIRVPCVPAATLVKHKSACNGMVWAPHSSCHICTASDDAMAVIWDVAQIPKGEPDAILAYTAPAAINQVQWSAIKPEWIGITYEDTLELLRV
eukprot:TRINITY_DN7654_c0_g1_i1.p1 TRINITY_DN7654_c0_g1~~TRINITY_DN7654_c0_g1_i1.p1  ORF type:complete len:345 (+),score=58.53 TRINITY_DN7654_c0_g1_i1:150-1184(+)